MIVNLLRKLSRVIKRNGVIGGLGIVADQARDQVAALLPPNRAKAREIGERERMFDQALGVDTGGFIHPTELNLTSPNQMHAVAYRATDPEDFRKAIRELSIDYRRFTFVDFGSGKGRTLLLATEFQFQSIIGVEFSEELHRIAQANISQFVRTHREEADIKSICMDAANFSLPEAPLVCYFCNPFGAPIMSKVIANIHESFRSHPRDIFIVYYNAKEGHLFDHAGCFKQIVTNGWARVWQLTPEMKAVTAPC
jgi:SAM-dependent methyltransferase